MAHPKPKTLELRGGHWQTGPDGREWYIPDHPEKDWGPPPDDAMAQFMELYKEYEPLREAELREQARLGIHQAVLQDSAPMIQVKQPEPLQLLPMPEELWRHYYNEGNGLVHHLACKERLLP